MHLYPTDECTPTTDTVALDDTVDSSHVDGGCRDVEESDMNSEDESDIEVTPAPDSTMDGCVCHGHVDGYETLSGDE
jgi:hypothetical protein